jgi:hypothetical protein
MYGQIYCQRITFLLKRLAKPNGTMVNNIKAIERSAKAINSKLYGGSSTQ